MRSFLFILCFLLGADFCLLPECMAASVNEVPAMDDPAQVFVPQKAAVTVDMGTSIMSHVGSSVFVQPTIMKQVSPRLRLAASLRYTRYDLKPLPWTTYEESGDNASVRLSVAGIYDINDKWTVWGAVTHQMGDARFGFAAPYDSFTLGAEYRPNDCTWIRAEVNVQRGSGLLWGPYLYDDAWLYGRPWYAFNSPFLSTCIW